MVMYYQSAWARFATMAHKSSVKSALQRTVGEGDDLYGEETGALCLPSEKKTSALSQFVYPINSADPR